MLESTHGSSFLLLIFVTLLANVNRSFTNCDPFTCSRYVIVYFSILYLRYQAGKVTDEMLSLPKSPLIVIGLLEALAAASGMASGGNSFIRI